MPNYRLYIYKRGEVRDCQFAIYILFLGNPSEVIFSSSADVSASLRGCFRGIVVAGIALFVEAYKSTLVYIPCQFISNHFAVKNPRNARVTSAEELGTMSKNNLKRIFLGIRPIWRIHYLILPLLAYTASRTFL